MIGLFNKYKEALIKEEKNFNPIWNKNKLGYSQIWGKLTEIYRSFGYPETYEEFYDLYTKKFSNRYFDSIPNMLKGLSDKPLDLCKAYVFKKVIVSVVDGFKKEREAKRIVESYGYQFVEPTPDQDISYGVDGLAYKNGELKFAIQVKPHTFFRGDRWDLVRDRDRAVYKLDLFSKLNNNVSVYYMIYEDNKWLMHDGILCFDPFSPITFD